MQASALLDDLAADDCTDCTDCPDTQASLGDQVVHQSSERLHQLGALQIDAPSEMPVGSKAEITYDFTDFPAIPYVSPNDPNYCFCTDRPVQGCIRVQLVADIPGVTTETQEVCVNPAGAVLSSYELEVTYPVTTGDYQLNAAAYFPASDELVGEASQQIHTTKKTSACPPGYQKGPKGGCVPKSPGKKTPVDKFLQWVGNFVQNFLGWAVPDWVAALLVLTVILLLVVVLQG